MRSYDGCLPDDILDAIFTGGVPMLSAEVLAVAQAHLSSCSACQSRGRAMQEELNTHLTEDEIRQVLYGSQLPRSRHVHLDECRQCDAAVEIARSSECVPA